MKKAILLIAVIAGLLVPLAAQSVEVVSPNGGEPWVLNSTQTIVWKSTKPGNVKVDIVLRNSGGKVGPIKSQVSLASGSWPWLSVGKLEDGTVVAPGTDYIVRIRDGGNTFGDESNAAFTISGAPPPGGPASITVTSPNGGESWFAGSPHYISWKAENWTGTVRLELWQNGVDKGDIALGISSSLGKYSWQVGKLVSGSGGRGSGYTVRVVREYRGGPYSPVPMEQLKDESDNPFSIGHLGQSFQIADAKAPIHVTKPAEGAVYYYGSFGKPVADGIQFGIYWETECQGPFMVTLCDGKGGIIRNLGDSNWVRLTPADTPVGQYRFKIQSVDGKCAGTSGRFSIKYNIILGQKKPDMRVCLLRPRIVHANGSAPVKAHVTLYVRNAGTKDSIPCHLRYTFKNGESGEVYVAACPSGSTSQVDFDAFFSGGGPWPYTFIVDCLGEIDELNENDNILDGTIPNQEPEEAFKCSGPDIY